MSPRSLRFVRDLSLAGVAVAWLLAGCGGGGGDKQPRPITSPSSSPTPTPTPTATPPPPPAATEMRVRVTFPATTRLVPQAAQSVVAELRGENETLLATHTFTRPAEGGVREFVFTNVPRTDITVKTSAYETPTGTGTPLAVGVQVVSNRTGAGPTVEVAMASTITGVAITTSAPQVDPDEGATLHAVARNDAGQNVPTVPTNWQWASSDPSVATVEPSGPTALVRGIRAGTVEIRATDSESGASGTLTVPVLNRAPTLFVRDGKSLFWFNSRTARAATRTTALAFTAIQERVVLLKDGNLVVNYGDKVALVDRTTGTVGAASASFGYGSNGVHALLALNDRVLVHTTMGFSIVNPYTGLVESKHQHPVFNGVADMTLGPDGKIYLVAGSRDGQGSDDVIARIALNANGTIQEETILRKESGVSFTGLRFLSDGNLAVLDRTAKALRLYSVSGASALPLASTAPVGDGAARIDVGRNILEAGDEILFATTSRGVRRFSYKAGVFAPLDQESAPFLPDGGTAVFWEDVLIAPNN